jgi:hypothetical protein
MSKRLVNEMTTAPDADAVRAILRDLQVPVAA